MLSFYEGSLSTLWPEDTGVGTHGFAAMTRPNGSTTTQSGTKIRIQVEKMVWPSNVSGFWMRDGKLLRLGLRKAALIRHQVPGKEIRKERTTGLQQGEQGNREYWPAKDTTERQSDIASRDRPQSTAGLHEGWPLIVRREGPP